MKLTEIYKIEDLHLLSSLDIKKYRTELLAETDWWAVQDRTMTQAEKDYRQALRDIPQQEGFPTNIVWPTKPE